jgi:hypothetical protein
MTRDAYKALMRELYLLIR